MPCLGHAICSGASQRKSHKLFFRPMRRPLPSLSRSFVRHSAVKREKRRASEEVWFPPTSCLRPTRTNERRDERTLYAAGAAVRGGAVVCGRQNRHSNCNNFSPIRRHDSLAAVEGRGAVSGGGGKNHLPPPPPPVAFRTSSINVKRANSRIKLGPHLHSEERADDVSDVRSVQSGRQFAISPYLRPKTGA